MSAPTTTTLDAIATFRRECMFKGLRDMVFIGPASATPITSLTTGASAALKPLPTAGGTYRHVGLLDKGDGINMTRKPDTSDTTSLGFTEPTRRDISKDDRTIKFTAQESNRLNLELYEGLDLSAVTPDASTGEVAFASPSRPQTIDYRVLVLMADGEGATLTYCAKFYPRCNVTDLEDIKATDGDDPAVYGITLSALLDSVLGYSIYHIWGGPGWKATLPGRGWQV